LLAATAIAAAYYLYDGATRNAPPTAEQQWQAVNIEVLTEPPAARVFVDGVLQVGNPLRLPRSDQPFEMRVEAPGYRTSLLRFIPDRNQTLRVRLKRRK
jgi:hypothetical protein